MGTPREHLLESLRDWWLVGIWMDWQLWGTLLVQLLDWLLLGSPRDWLVWGILRSWLLVLLSEPQEDLVDQHPPKSLLQL